MGIVACNGTSRKNVQPITVDEIESAVKNHQANERDYELLSRLTHFDVETVRRLHQRFCEIDSIEQDEMIDTAELVEALNLGSNSLLGERIFAYFDKLGNGGLGFRNFVMALNGLSEQAPLEEKIKISFYLYDVNQDGCIDASEIRCLVDAALEGSQQNWSEEQRQQICTQTFNDVDSNGDGVVQFDEYAEYARHHPQLLRAFTVNIQEIIGDDHRRKRVGTSLTADRRSLNRGPLAVEHETSSRFKRPKFSKYFRKTEKVKKVAHASQICTDKI